MSSTVMAVLDPQSAEMTSQSVSQGPAYTNL